jgi:hypothetical protein
MPHLWAMLRETVGELRGKGLNAIQLQFDRCGAITLMLPHED